MSDDTNATPADAQDAIDQAVEVLGQAAQPTNGNGHVYDVDSSGAVKDWRRPDPAREQGEIIAKEADFRNGAGQVGDPVLVNGRRGAVIQFLFLAARDAKRQKRPNGVDVIIRFDEGEPKERQMNPAEVDLLLDEITRAPRPPVSEQTTAYGVPTEASFGDDDVKLAGDLRQIGVNLIQSTEDFPKLRTLSDQIAFFWVKKGGSSGGQPKLAGTRLTNKFERRVTKSRLSVWVAADVARDLLLKLDEIEAVVHECLCRIERDEHGNLRLRAPDFHGFARNVARFGATVPHVKAAAQALNVEVKDVRNLRLDLEPVAAGAGAREGDLGV